MDIGTNLQMWLLVVGFLNPLALSVINQPSWSNTLRSVLAFVWSAITAAATLYFTDHTVFSRGLITAGLLVFVTTIATYRGFWKTSGVAPAIEVKTSPGATSHVAGH